MQSAMNTFNAINLFDEQLILNLSNEELRPILPCLVRMTLCPTLDQSIDWQARRKQLLCKISHLEEVNQIVSLLAVDFQALDNEIKKTIRQKPSESPPNFTLEIESTTPLKKLTLFFNEFYLVQQKAFRAAQQANQQQQQQSNHHLKPIQQRYISSELFDHDLYVDLLSDIICVLLGELPNTFQMFEVVETLLSVRTGAELICRIAMNYTESFSDLCQHLLERADREDEDSFMAEKRMQVIRLLCRMNPKYALVVRSAAVQLCRMPALCIHLTIDHLCDEQSSPGESDGQNVSCISNLVSFLSGLLLGNDERIRAWFSQYIRAAQKKLDSGQQVPTIQLMRQQLLFYLQYLLQCISDKDYSEPASHTAKTVYIIQGSALLKLYCALRGLAGMKFTDPEITGIVNLITIHPPPDAAGIRFASIGLCMLLAAPSLTASSEGEKKILRWLHWIVKEESLFGQVSGHRSSFGEMLLLIAIHFHSSQASAIAGLVSTVLGIKMHIRQNSMTKIKAIFVQEIFPDQMVAAHAIKVSVTNNLNSLIPGYLPVHCIYQLLKSRAFTKYKVPIKDWIFKQVCQSCAPINPVLPSLVEIYVNSVLIPCQKQQQQQNAHSTINTNEPISEDELMSVFNHRIYSVEEEEKMDITSADQPVHYLTTQLLLLYYVLLYEEVRLNQTRTLPNSERSIKKYSPELFSHIPVYYLMQEARREQNNYGILFPSLLKLISTHHPHLCQVTDWVYASNLKSSSFTSQKQICIKKLKANLQDAFDNLNHNQSQLANFCDKILTLPCRYLWPLAEGFISNLFKLLPPETPELVLDKAKKVWWRLNNVFPDEFRVMTINAIAQNKLNMRKQSWKDVVLDPLHILRCDERVFISPEFMEIQLHMLQAFLIASRTYFMHHLQETPSKSPEEEKDREELRFALLQSQESAAIQILLEACRERSEFNNKPYLQKKLSEVQRLVCIHLHQVFIADPNLAKLVHFQGYDSRLLKLVVEKVPSMHICLDFIPELLSQPDLNKQIFAVQLCSYLCEHYAIPKSLSIAKLCFNLTNTLLGILPSEKRSTFFIPVLPALIRMCRPFPPLYEDAVLLLIQISQICLSFLAAKSPTFIAPSISIGSQTSLENLDWITAAKFFSSLPTNDALSRTIRESFCTLLSIESVKQLIET